MNRDKQLHAAYRASIERHGWRVDPAQERALAHLEALRVRLTRDANRNSWFARLAPRRRKAAEETGRGVYLWGGVGRGKTFLMDLFCEHAGVPVHREHFHRFMKDVHRRLHGLRDLQEPLVRVAEEIRGVARVLCLDELYVSDIADAMILAGLFDAFVRQGSVLVCTSNSPPGGLYREGLQRARFLPAIALLERHTQVVNVDGDTDYRLRQLEKAPLYFDSAVPEADRRLAERFRAIAGNDGMPGGSIRVEGRSIATVQLAADVAWFAFGAICDGPRSQVDYVEVARDFHTVIVSGVPRFDPATEDQARRFIALVDELYDRNVKLVLSAAAPPELLYQGEKLAFEFARTRSRLVEMQTHEYLARSHKG